MAIKKSDLYSSLWASCDELRGGMDASHYKDYAALDEERQRLATRAHPCPEQCIKERMSRLEAAALRLARATSGSMKAPECRGPKCLRDPARTGLDPTMMHQCHSFLEISRIREIYIAV